MDMENCERFVTCSLSIDHSLIIPQIYKEISPYSVSIDHRPEHPPNITILSTFSLVLFLLVTEQAPIYKGILSFFQVLEI
jgi:hypothetical protein